MILIARILWVLPIIVFAIVILSIIAHIVFFKSRNKKKNSSVLNLLTKILSDRKINVVSILSVKNEDHDIYLETKNSILYIKIVDNFTNNEICINNSTKWEFRSAELNPKIKYVPGIEGLMIREIPKDTNKKIIKKIYIVYPNAHSILKYINECEMIFVAHDTDVYGTNVITYRDIYDDNQILDIK